MLLYDSRVSGNCYKVRLLLAQLELPCERREVDVVDRSGRKDLLGELNPALRVPTLVLDDGRSLAESNAILFHLAEGSEYLPSDGFDRAKVLQWLFFEQYSHEPYIAVPRYWLTIAPGEPDRRELESRQAAAQTALAALERHLAAARFLVADSYTIADIALYAYTHLADEAGLDLTPYPAIRRWLAAVATQPRHVPIDA